jgi:hypothetical protein
MCVLCAAQSVAAASAVLRHFVDLQHRAVAHVPVLGGSGSPTIVSRITERPPSAPTSARATTRRLAARTLRLTFSSKAR